MPILHTCVLEHVRALPHAKPLPASTPAPQTPRYATGCDAYPSGYCVQATLMIWLLQVHAGENAWHVGPAGGRATHEPVAEQASAILNAHISLATQSLSVAQVPPASGTASSHVPV